MMLSITFRWTIQGNLWRNVIQSLIDFCSPFEQKLCRRKYWHETFEFLHRNHVNSRFDTAINKNMETEKFLKPNCNPNKSQFSTALDEKICLDFLFCFLGISFLWLGVVLSYCCFFLFLFQIWSRVWEQKRNVLSRSLCKRISFGVLLCLLNHLFHFYFSWKDGRLEDLIEPPLLHVCHNQSRKKQKREKKPWTDETHQTNRQWNRGFL